MGGLLRIVGWAPGGAAAHAGVGCHAQGMVDARQRMNLKTMLHFLMPGQPSANDDDVLALFVPRAAASPGPNAKRPHASRPCNPGSPSGRAPSRTSFPWSARKAWCAIGARPSPFRSA